MNNRSEKIQKQKHTLLFLPFHNFNLTSNLFSYKVYSKITVIVMLNARFLNLAIVATKAKIIQT
jgi:hypothetical protein